MKQATPAWARLVPRSTFRSLRHPNYRLYFIGQIISLTGTWMQTAALMWLAYTLTGQYRWSAYIAAAPIFPTLLFGPLGGWLADHCSKRRLIMGAQVGFLVLSVLLAALVLAGGVSRWNLLAIMLLRGIVQAIDLPARLAFVPGLVAREDLGNAVALNSLIFNAARLLGPALAGLVLISVGAAGCFLFNSFSYLAVLLALSWMVLPEEPREPVNGRRPSFLSGFSIVLGQPRLLMLILLAGCVAICGWPILPLLPGFAERVLQLGADGYTQLLSAIGCGALMGSLTVATFGKPSRNRWFLLLGIAIVAGSLSGLAVITQPIWALACCSLFGFGMILFFPTGQSMVQLGAADHQRGRVMALWAMMMSTAMPFGNLILGPLADVWGVQVVFRNQGLAAALVFAVMATIIVQSILRRSLRPVAPDRKPAALTAGRQPLD